MRIRSGVRPRRLRSSGVARAVVGQAVVAQAAAPVCRRQELVGSVFHGAGYASGIQDEDRRRVGFSYEEGVD